MNRPSRQPTPGPSRPPATDAPAAPGPLLDALSAEHAAIFAYGPIGTHLEDELAQAAAEAESAHRDRRDALMLALAQVGAPAPGPEPDYQLPFEVTDADAALRLAIHVEERVAGIWRAVLWETTGTTRAEALDALADAAVWATRWRSSAGITPATVPFPGAP